MRVSVDGIELVTMGGVARSPAGYLENGTLMAAGDPQPLSRAGLQAMATQNRRHTFRDPIPLTELAKEIVRLTPHAPEIRRDGREGR